MQTNRKRLFLIVFFLTTAIGFGAVAGIILIQQSTREADPPLISENIPSTTPGEALSPTTPEDAHAHVMTLEEMHQPLEEAIPNWPSPTKWDDSVHVVLYLNEEGAQGTHLRNGPGIEDYSVIKILWDLDRLQYLHFFVPDPEAGVYWLHVLSPTGVEGYVDSRLVGVWEE